MKIDWTIQSARLWVILRPTLIIQIVHILEFVEKISHSKYQVDGISFDMIFGTHLF